MNWASGRRLIILAFVLLLALIVAGAAAYFALNKAPSCTDGKMNGGETGIDCGGPCARQCTADVQAPTVSFAVPIQVGSRTDLVAYVVNQNRDAAAKGAKFHVEFRDASGNLLATKDGTIDLLPGSTAPLYIPNAYAGATPATQAFLTFDAVTWYRYSYTKAIPSISDAKLTGTDAPRVTATVENPAVTDLPSVKLIATLFDASGNVVAASQTVTPSIPGQGSVEATFTWPAALPPVARIDIRPVLPL